MFEFNGPLWRNIFFSATDDSEDRLDELLEEEEELSDNDDSSTSDHTKHSHMEESESLVVSVIGQLEELAKHIRKVSMPPGVSPAPIFTNSIDQDDSPADSNEELSNYPPPIHSRVIFSIFVEKIYERSSLNRAFLK